jgi:ribonucleoside-diphosphate reductase alpha chain
MLYSLISGNSTELPDYFETAQTLDAEAHLEMIKALAPFVDAAISKTVNLPASYAFDDFESLYLDAWAAGLKGLTTYRPNEEVGQILTSLDDEEKPADIAKAVEVVEIDPDRRVSINALPQPVMSALRWLERPQMLDGNPAVTYMVENPQGDFAVMVGHYMNGVTHPFETWVNGAEVPRGLGAIAKTLSVDMRSYDAGWLKMKLESLKRADPAAPHRQDRVVGQRQRLQPGQRDDVPQGAEGGTRWHVVLVGKCQESCNWRRFRVVRQRAGFA